jgi:hypothetical protein
VRRPIIGLVVALLASLVMVSPADAAQGQTTHFRFHGSFAEAAWFTSTNTTATDTYINVQKTKKGGEALFVDQFTAHLDANGNPTGYTDTSADVTSGFSFTIKKDLTSASVSGSNLPATTCTYDLDFNQIGCSDTTISVDASWTGFGPISHETAHDHFRSDGFSENDHFNGTSRNATATGTIGGLTLTADDLEFADMGSANSGSTVICIGNSC